MAERGLLGVTSLDRGPMIRYGVEDVVRVDYSPCPSGETSRRGFFEGWAKDFVNVGERQILPIDVARVLRPAAEFVIPAIPATSTRSKYESKVTPTPN